jgi:hypothetical protein
MEEAYPLNVPKVKATGKEVSYKQLIGILTKDYGVGY